LQLRYIDMATRHKKSQKIISQQGKEIAVKEMTLHISRDNTRSFEVILDSFAR
jgi:hypothetical protein